MKSIWQKDDDCYTLAPFTDALRKQAEEKLNVTLPQSYINILKEKNGGSIIYDAYPTAIPTVWADDHIHIDHILGIGEQEGILESEYLIQEWGLPKHIVVISGSGHSWVAFDYRNTREDPPVIFIDADQKQIIEMAPNFDAFLQGLYLEEVETEDVDPEHPARNWTMEEMTTALASNDELEVCHALDYLYANPTGHAAFIEQQLVTLLQHANLEMKQIAANYAYHFHEKGVLSPPCVEKIVSIMRNDDEIEYYADMFFSENR